MVVATTLPAEGICKTARDVEVSMANPEARVDEAVLEARVVVEAVAVVVAHLEVEVLLSLRTHKGLVEDSGVYKVE